MNSEINFLYCFDKNYNKQAIVSINSLIEKMESNFRIHIIHSEAHKFDISKIVNIDNLAKIFIYQFVMPEVILPNSSVAHISQATYYKLFCADFIKDNIDFLVYIDSDFLCMNNPTLEINYAINQMKKESKPLAAYKEYHLRDNIEDDPKQIKLLKLSNKKYFNAGFLILDFKYFSQKSTRDKILEIVKTRGTEITMMDQDILNLHFDGNFVELRSLLNFNLSLEKYPLFDKEFVKNNVIFIHYKGKPKPWEIKYSARLNSQYYQDAYRKYNSNNYFLISKNKRTDIKFLIINIFTLDFLNVQKRFRYLSQAIFATFKKN